MKYLLSLAALALAGAAPAADTAKTIAPYIDESTVAVLRIDVARFDPAAAVDLAAPVRGHWAEQEAEAKRFLGKLHKELAAAGVRELAFLIRPAEFNDPVSLVTPLPPGVDGRKLAEALRRLGTGPGDGIEATDAAVLAGSKGSLARLKAARGAGRPELEKAFAAAGDAAVQLVVVPSKDH